MKKGIHILHLEDDPEDASLIEEKLKAEKIDCTIKLVQTQNEFENALKDNSIDLVLADYNLPGYDGLKALKFSKKFYTEI
ncbi:MAG: response regulator, partial [Bacteroidales bacterium]|nr:response regulator [Bacteroidales bacterium]